MFLALPTVHGVIFLLAAIASLGVAFVNVGLGSALVASLFCGFAAASFFLAQFSLYGVKVSREKMSDSFCGSVADLRLVIQNGAPFPRMAMVVTEKSGLFPGGILHTAVPALRGRETYLLPRHVKLASRGQFLLEKISLAGGDPAGLFRRKKDFYLPDEILVAPKIVSLYSFPHLQRNRRVTPGQEGRPLSIAGIGLDFFGIRPFRPGDELRYVHWKSTAAKRKLMIKEMEAQTVDHVALLLDTNLGDCGISEKESNLEFQITCAASILEYLSSSFCYFSFYCRMKGELVDLHGDATGLKGKVLNVLTNIKPEKQNFEELLSSIIQQLEPGTVLFVLSLSCTGTLAEKLAVLQEHHIYVHWIYAPMINFPHIDDETALVLDPEAVKLFQSGDVSPCPVSRLSDINKVMEQC